MTLRNAQFIERRQQIVYPLAWEGKENGFLMRSAKADQKIKVDLLKYEIDPATGEVYVGDEQHSRILLKDYEGNVVLPAYPYGIGIDVHRDFIQISVMVRNGQNVKEYHFQSSTDYDGLFNARDVAMRMIETFSNPHIEVKSNELRYACESTGNYHHPLLKVWDGHPVVVNPSIAKAGRRKSDRIDAFILAQNALMGTWPESFVITDEVNVLRALFQQRRHCERRATQIGNSINSELLRFGVNIGRDGSVTKDAEVRAHVIDQLSECPQMEPGCLHDYLPSDVKALLKNNYAEWDRNKEKSAEYLNQIREKIESMQWKCGDGEKNGKEMVELLMTVPGIGELTAMIWLTHIVDVRRFSTYEKCIAYCGYDPSNATSAGKVVNGKKRKGNKELHEAISRCAGTLLRVESEPFGKWAARIYGRSSKWKKARNALGRKLVTALYYVQKNGQPFSYDMYRIEEPLVMDIPLERLVEIEPGFRRYMKILIPMGVSSTKQIVHTYHICGFKRVKGVGQGFYNLVKMFIDNQDDYREKYQELYREEWITYAEEDRDDCNE